MKHDFTNKEVFEAVCNHENLRFIPKTMVALGYMLAHANAAPPVVSSNLDLYAQMCLDFSQDKDYETIMYPVGFFMDIVATMGSGLTNKSGAVSTNGIETVNTPECMEQLHPYDCSKSKNIADIERKVRAVKQADPNTPTFVIVNNQPMLASELMGASVYYKSFRKNRDFIFEMQDLVEEPLFEGLEKLAEAGVDIIWFPMPTMGGTCITKEAYTSVCHQYSKRAVEFCHNLGMKAIVHTCGNWNDRFDVVVEEKPDIVHLSEANLAEFHNEYGAQVSMMGNISVVKTLMYKDPDGVYADSYQACLDAASDGNYVIAPDCGMSGDIPEANVRAMYRAADDASKELFG